MSTANQTSTSTIPPEDSTSDISTSPPQQSTSSPTKIPSPPSLSQSPKRRVMKGATIISSQTIQKLASDDGRFWVNLMRSQMGDQIFEQQEHLAKLYLGNGQDHTSSMEELAQEFDQTQYGTESLFTIFDEDESGFLTHEEFHDGLKSQNLLHLDESSVKFEELCQLVDSNGDGQISLEEFQVCLERLRLARLHLLGRNMRLIGKSCTLHCVDYDSQTCIFQLPVADQLQFFFAPDHQTSLKNNGDIHNDKYDTRWCHINGHDNLVILRLAVKHGLHPMAVLDALNLHQKAPVCAQYGSNKSKSHDDLFVVCPQLRLTKESLDELRNFQAKETEERGDGLFRQFNVNQDRPPVQATIEHNPTGIFYLPTSHTLVSIELDWQQITRCERRNAEVEMDPRFRNAGESCSAFLLRKICGCCNQTVRFRSKSTIQSSKSSKSISNLREQTIQKTSLRNKSVRRTSMAASITRRSSSLEKSGVGGKRNAMGSGSSSSNGVKTVTKISPEQIARDLLGINNNNSTSTTSITTDTIDNNTTTDNNTTNDTSNNSDSSSTTTTTTDTIPETKQQPSTTTHTQRKAPTPPSGLPPILSKSKHNNNNNNNNKSKIRKSKSLSHTPYPKADIDSKFGDHSILSLVLHSLSKKYTMLRRSGIDRLLHNILDNIVKNYQPIARAYRIELEFYQCCLSYQEANFKKEHVTALLRIKRELRMLGHQLQPVRTAMSSLIKSGNFDNDRSFFQDIEDGLRQILFEIETCNELAVELNENFNHYHDRRMNDVLYVLTIVTTCVIPTQLFTGVFGMNFATDNNTLGLQDPMLRYEYGYYYFWVFSFFSTLIGAFVFRMCMG